MKAYVYLRQIYWGKENKGISLLLECVSLKLKQGQVKLAF